MAQYKLRQRPGVKQPEVSKRGGGFNVVVVLICALLSVLIWFYAIGTSNRENQDAGPDVLGAETGVTDTTSGA